MRTISEIAQQFKVPPNLVAHGKRQLLADADEFFEGRCFSFEVKL